MHILPDKLHNCLTEHLSMVAPAGCYQICCALATFHQYPLGTSMSGGHSQFATVHLVHLGMSAGHHHLLPLLSHWSLLYFQCNIVFSLKSMSHIWQNIVKFKNKIKKINKKYEPGLPWWLTGKESTCQCRERGFDPWTVPHASEWLSPCATTIEPVL